MIWDGGVVPVTVRSCSGIEKVVVWIPEREERAAEISEVQDSQRMGTENVAVYGVESWSLGVGMVVVTVVVDMVRFLFADREE